MRDKLTLQMSEAVKAIGVRVVGEGRERGAPVLVRFIFHSNTANPHDVIATASPIAVSGDAVRDAYHHITLGVRRTPPEHRAILFTTSHPQQWVKLPTGRSTSALHFQ